MTSSGLGGEHQGFAFGVYQQVWTTLHYTTPHRTTSHYTMLNCTTLHNTIHQVEGSDREGSPVYKQRQEDGLGCVLLRCTSPLPHHLLTTSSPPPRDSSPPPHHLLAITQPLLTTSWQPPDPLPRYREHWVVRLVAPGGGEGDTVLQAAARGASPLPPAAGWTYLDVGSQAYLPDPSLAVVKVQAAGCGEVDVVLGAEAGAGQAEVGGLYRPTGGWSAGRQVWLKRTLVHSCTPPLPSTPLHTPLHTPESLLPSRCSNKLLLQTFT